MLLESSPKAPLLRSMSPGDRTVVSMLSVFSEPVALTYLVRGLSKVGYHVSDRTLNNEEVKPVLRRLAEQGVVTGDSHFSVAAEQAHAAMRISVNDGCFGRMAEVVRAIRPAQGRNGERFSSGAMALRELRIELYAGRWDAVRAVLHALPRYLFSDICRPFDRAWVAALPADLRAHALAGVVEHATVLLEPVEEAFSMLEAEGELTSSEHRILVEQLIFRGRLDDAARRLTGRASVEADVDRAFLSFLGGATPQAIAAYEAALKAYSKLAGKRSVVFPDRTGLFFPVALLAEGSPASLARAAAYADVGKRVEDGAFLQVYAALSELVDVLSGRLEPEGLLHVTSERNLALRDPIAILLQAAACLWAKVARPAALTAELKKRKAAAEIAGFRWFAAQAGDILASAQATATDAKVMGPDIRCVRLSRLVFPRERWTGALEALLAIASGKKATRALALSSDDVGDRRLVWLVRATRYGIEIEPREQVRSKGVWTKGRPVALKRLFEQAKALDFLTAADLAACKGIEQHVTYEGYRRYENISHTLDSASALLALAGSPNVLIEVSDGSFAPCEIKQAAPRLEVSRAGGRLSLSLVPRPVNDSDPIRAVVSGPQSVDVVTFEPIHHAIGRALGPKPLEVPTAGERPLRAVLQALSGKVAVHADLPDPKSGGESEDEAGEATPGDPRPWFVLRALGEGLSVAVQVRPLGVGGPTARPGQGGATLFAQVSGHRARATRDLSEEKRRLSAALVACPVLSACRGGDADFVIADRDQALEAQLELRALGDAVAIDGPEGKALKPSDAIGIEHLRWTLTSDGGSFLADGTLTLPNGKQAKIVDLLDYLSASPSRFLPLAGHEGYLALTAELRERLDDLLGLSERARRGLRFHPLAASLVAPLLGDQALVDEGFRRQVASFAESGAEPVVPSTLRGELRPYQVDGFRWLSRLSGWGAGGCLADDMGLGKTLQAIALLLHRAPLGPALVVTPTSVVSTWADEVARFAPTLRVRVFAGRARAKDLVDLGPFDLLLTSYSHLQIDADALAEITFATAVLDEAQVIKNAETKRARAAMGLRALQRVATTGTPVENRLDDLHSIFSFLNPGLLGSAKAFQARFAGPIERDRDPRARDRLRRLIAPFILRRTKTEVAPELPARTEVTLRVPLEVEEMAIYEVIREEALAALPFVKKGAGAGGSQRFQILAAITRLRLAASNARLVLPDVAAPSAKLAALGELLDDLLPNHHKVLVFSQFVVHLALVAEMLDERGVSFQYLDGDTPTAVRKAAVDGFQAGQGEVFLISLKAGGFGLNLTAADYVVHMDPWWNPAVEDQASDRAHRIGQSRPVTIYRIVARDTIEDRILRLHHRKRELAAGVLSGSDLSGRMTEAELLDLVRAGAFP